jgi:hypothetical protein
LSGTDHDCIEVLWHDLSPEGWWQRCAILLALARICRDVLRGADGPGGPLFRVDYV